ncbi:DUF7331 family protein [Natrialbaceae archaeon A-gly3]
MSTRDTNHVTGPDSDQPGPSPDTRTYATDDGETVIYDDSRLDAWISSTHAVSLPEAE